MKIVEAFLDLNDSHKQHNRLYISKLSYFADIHLYLLVNIGYKYHYATTATTDTIASIHSVRFGDIVIIKRSR